MKAPHGPAVAPGPRASRRTSALAGAGLALAAVAVYANSFSGRFIFDDFLSIPQNPTLRSLITALAPPAGGVTVTGRPFLNLSFALNYAVSGDHVWSYHALNLLIHMLAGLTLFGIVRRTLAGPGDTRRRPDSPTSLLPLRAAAFGSFGGAVLWTVHPLEPESVTYIVQRAESLMGLLYLLTLYFFIRGAEPGRTGCWFAAAFVSCLLGMATKEVMVSAPVIVLLYDRTFLTGSFGAAWRRRRRVHLALAGTWILLAVLVLHAANRGGTAGFGIGVSFWSYAATQFQALAHYLWLTVWPHPLILDYGAQWVASVGDIVPYAAVVALLVAATVAAFIRRPKFGFLGVFFFAILAPTTLVPGARQTLAEHRMYLSLAPVLVLLVLALRAWLGRRARFVVAAAAVGLGWVSVRRNAVYRSSASIWRDTVEHRPENAPAHNNYGNILAQAGQPAQAMAQYAAAIRIDPGYADAYYNAGNALKQLGRYSDSIGRYEQALRINPNMPDAQVALGTALEDAGRGGEAAAHFEQALRLDPNYADADNELGLTLARAGRTRQAIARYEQALKIDPNLADVRNNLGNALRAAGRGDEAIAQYRQALRIKPDYAAAENNLGLALASANRLPEAIACLDQALKVDPAAPEVHNDLGMVLVMAGRAQEGIAQFEEALRLNPNFARAHLNLAITLKNLGQSDEAAAQFEAARRLGAAVPRPGD